MKRKTQRTINKSGTGICEICEKQTILVQHHIRGRKIHNANHPSNLANICSNCHTDVHHGIIVIEDRLMTSAGYKLIWHNWRNESITGNDAKPWLIN